MPSISQHTRANNALAQRLYAEARPSNLVPAATHVNAAMRESYVPPASNHRDCGNKAIKSLPMVAQISRA